MMPYVRHRRGFGQVTAGQVSSVGAGASTVASAVASNAPTSTKIEASAAGALFSAAPFTGPAAPFVAAAGAVAALLATMGVGSGCGQTCVLSTTYANHAEQALQQNIETYFGIPAPRVQTQKDAGLAIFDTMWNDLVAQCSNPALGNAGKRCISDRQAGACTWKQTSTSPLLQYPGEPQPGACWNWFSGYRDPIASDQVVPDSAASTLSSAGSSIANALSSAASSLNVSPLLLVAGLGLAVWAVAS